MCLKGSFVQIIAVCSVGVRGMQARHVLTKGASKCNAKKLYLASSDRPVWHLRRDYVISY